MVNKVAKKDFWNVFLLVLVVHFLDMLTTWFALSRADTFEANPLSHWFISIFGMYYAFLLKGILIDVSLIFITLYFSSKISKVQLIMASYMMFLFSLYFSINNWFGMYLGWW